MALKRKLVRDTFSCSVCLSLLKDPVTIPCGHSYCMSCIKTYWDGEDQRKIYSCPQCRKYFLLRPALMKNFMLAELVEELKKPDLRAAPAGPEDVSCDVCSDRKLKAAKSCLNCLVSYCEKHLQPHFSVGQFKKHQLVEPSRNLLGQISSRHDEVMKILVDEIEAASAAAERAEKQKQLEAGRRQIQQRIQERQKDVELLQQEVEAINVSADRTVEDSQKIFTQLIRLIQKRSSDVKRQLRSQQETEASRVKELQEKLQQEMTELKRKDAELEQLSHTEDHNQFLHNYPSVSALSESPHSSSIQTRPLTYFEDVTAAVEELRDKLQDDMRDSKVKALMSEPEPRTRYEFLKYSQDITMDPNTADTHLLLSDGNRKATLLDQQQIYPAHPDRFTDCQQVLSRQSLSGRCYWEVEWRGRGVCVAVSYKIISRNMTENDCRFGFNDKSWAINLGASSFSFRFNRTCTPVPGRRSSRIGVYLDHPAGVLSFYSVSETMTLLHRVRITFAQPLHAGVRFYDSGDSAEFIKLKK